MAERTNAQETPQQKFEDFKNNTLRSIFQEIFPVPQIYNYGSELRFTKHKFRDPRLSEEECKKAKKTYSEPLVINLEYESMGSAEVKEQEVYLCDFPKMTPRGTFIILGTELQPKSDVTKALREELLKGFHQMVSTTQRRMAKTEPEQATPAGLISKRPVSRAIERSLLRIALSQH